MLLSLLVTVPVPAPVLDTVNRVPVLKAAVTVVAAVMATVQVVAVVEVQPVHPLKVALPVGVSVKTMVSVGAKFAVQLEPQLMEVRLVASPLEFVIVELATVPVPVTETVSLFGVLVAIGASTQSSSMLRVVVP